MQNIHVDLMNLLPLNQLNLLTAEHITYVTWTLSIIAGATIPKDRPLTLQALIENLASVFMAVLR
jgi:hypothetical protein